MNTLQGAKYLWKIPSFDEKIVEKLVSDHTITFPIARVLYSRGFTSYDAVTSFLFCSFERDVAHASQLKDAVRAVERIEHAIQKKEKILIFGDYDVDGITSSSLCMIVLLSLNADVNFFIPNRVKHGYGISASIVEQAHKNDYKLIITVDNGISAYEAAAKAKMLGIDLIITDHHRPHSSLPDAFAIVNPQQEDCPYPFKGLPGVGVAFKFLSLLYERMNKQLPEKAYELLTLGIVADVMPLMGENRFWVQHGLSKINSLKSHAITELINNSKISKALITSRDIGFSIAPQINALGRLSDPREGVKFLISSNKEDVIRVGKILHELNEARRRIERTIFDDLEQAIASKNIDLEKENIIMACSEEWQPGVIGLVAGKLMHAHGRPTFLFHKAGNGIVKGSARSIEEFNLFNALEENKDLLLQFGGHSCAAGLSLYEKNVVELKERLEKKISKELTSFDLAQKIIIDAPLELQEIHAHLIHDLERLEPFGHKNPAPLFMINNVSLLKEPQLLKDKHVKCSLFSEGVIKPIIFFNRPDLFEPLRQLKDERFSVAAQVTTNEWNGKTSYELHGIDVSF